LRSHRRRARSVGMSLATPLRESRTPRRRDGAIARGRHHPNPERHSERPSRSSRRSVCEALPPHPVSPFARQAWRVAEQVPESERRWAFRPVPRPILQVWIAPSPAFARLRERRRFSTYTLAALCLLVNTPGGAFLREFLGCA
jgi:hypothetical protein